MGEWGPSNERLIRISEVVVVIKRSTDTGAGKKNSFEKTPGVPRRAVGGANWLVSLGMGVGRWCAERVVRGATEDHNSIHHHHIKGRKGGGLGRCAIRTDKVSP